MNELMGAVPERLQQSEDVSLRGASEDIEEGAGGMRMREQGAVRITWGVIDIEKVEAFERLLFRATRGNALFKSSVKSEYFENPESSSGATKVAFAVFSSGAAVEDKVNKLCQSMDARRYAVPRTRDEQARLLDEVRRELEDHKAVAQLAQRRQCELLAKLAGRLLDREKAVLREKAIYTTMNLFNTSVSTTTVIAEGWVPVAQAAEVRAALLRGMKRARASMPSSMHVVSTEATPPTLIKTNKLTASFQALNDAYGTPRYLELNPGMFYPVTYAFLFGIMFGDIGHGILLLLGALFLISREHAWGGKKLNELIQPAFDGRYVLLLMAIFSIYVGEPSSLCPQRSPLTLCFSRGSSLLRVRLMCAALGCACMRERDAAGATVGDGMALMTAGALLCRRCVQRVLRVFASAVVLLVAGLPGRWRALCGRYASQIELS